MSVSLSIRMEQSSSHQMDLREMSMGFVIKSFDTIRFGLKADKKHFTLGLHASLSSHAMTGLHI